jgi:hypothetical protein
VIVPGSTIFEIESTVAGSRSIPTKKLAGKKPAPDAIKNVCTWKFAGHAPTTLAVTCLYVNEGHFNRAEITKCSAWMELPRKVTVSTSF